MKEKLRLRRDQFMAFAFAASDLLIEVDRDGIVTFAAGASQGLLGRQAEELAGLSVESLVIPDDRALVHHLVRVIGPGSRRGPLTVDLLVDSGTRPATISAFKPWDRDLIHLAICAGHFQILSHEDKAARDSTTGLLRKETFAKVAEDLLRRAEAASSPLSLTHIGIPGLAELSERHGADAVGEFLAEAAALLRSFAYGDAATSLSESKYAILHDSGVSSAEIAAELQHLNIERHGDDVDLGITHYTSTTDDNACSTEDATRALIYTINEFADNAEGPVEIASLNSAIESRLSLAIDRINWFKRAVIQQDLQFVGQPIVWLNGGNMHHAEVLVRFQSNQSPFAHLQFAEKVGIIHELDFSVVEYVVAYLAAMQDNVPPPMPLAVNVSATSFERGDFVVKLMRLLESRIARPELLMFEVTESAEIKSLDRTNRVLQGLRKRGFKVCLDDFGAGAASFQYLRTLDVDMVKIDGHYVKTALKMRKEAEMLRAIASLCHKLNVMTVAEQVESETQADFLRDCGIDLAQGYHYAKPTPLVLPSPVMDSDATRNVATA